MKRKTTQPPKIGLVLSGSGPLWAIYEIGARCALQEFLKEIDLIKLDHHESVSASRFIAAGLANGMTQYELCASFIENDNRLFETFNPSWRLSPAYGKYPRHAIALPGLLASTAWHFTSVRKFLVHALDNGEATPLGRPG